MSAGCARRVRRLSLGSHGSVALGRLQRAGRDTRRPADCYLCAREGDAEYAGRYGPVASVIDDSVNDDLAAAE